MDTLSHHAPLGKSHYVYTLAYPDGRVFYVGKGIDNRIDEHETQARYGDKRNQYKLNVIRKIWREGGQVLKAKLAYFEIHEEAMQYEIALIFFMKPYGSLTNITDGGDGAMGLRHSEEARHKQSEAHKGRIPSNLEQLVALAKANKGKPGRPVSEEHRRKLIKARKGVPFSAEQKLKLKGRVPWNKGKTGYTLTVPEETRRKMSEASRGKTHSAETRRKLSEARKGQGKGRKQSPELIAKRAASNTGKKRSEETKRKMSKAQKGRNPSEKAQEHLHRLHEANKGRKQSAETRAKKSETMKRTLEQKRNRLKE